MLKKCATLDPKNQMVLKRFFFRIIVSILNVHCVNCSEALQKHKWEDATTVDKSAWTYRRNVNLNDLRTVEELITTLVQAVRYGGTLLQLFSFCCL